MLSLYVDCKNFFIFFFFYHFVFFFLLCPEKIAVTPSFCLFQAFFCLWRSANLYTAVWNQRCIFILSLSINFVVFPRRAPWNMPSFSEFMRNSRLIFFRKTAPHTSVFIAYDAKAPGRRQSGTHFMPFHRFLNLCRPCAAASLPPHLCFYRVWREISGAAAIRNSFLCRFTAFCTSAPCAAARLSAYP